MALSYHVAEHPTRSTAGGGAARGATAVRQFGGAAAAEVRLIEGHPLALAFLADRAMLMRYLRARGAGEEAEDLLQELWLKLGHGLVNTIDDHRAYLFRMAHNLMLDRHRAEQRRRGREDAFGTAAGGIDERPAALQSLLARERLAQVDGVLAALGARTDRIFRLHRVDGVPQRTIARELGISLSAVEKHVQKAYRALATMHSDGAGRPDRLASREVGDGGR
ncbi:RNA polymerase sigma factor [Sphingomonas sp.]|uniref:RNA polymerase sigma factor n=1 Tax=Sphingomonas sp. TaxID=28214 RepID=UPI0035BC0D86